MTQDIQQPRQTEQDDAESEFIAVVGLACRFPGARDANEFWRNLLGGVDSVTRSERRPVPGGRGDYVPARGLLAEPEYFDAAYFGFSPREARLLSPQHRVFLECAVEALDDSGHDPRRHHGAIGVYAGGADTGYGQLIRSCRDQLPAVSDWEILLGSSVDYLSSRVAYKLGLRGPAVAVQAACATSLVAVHMATQALVTGDCDIALAGGAAVHHPAKDSAYTEGGIIAKDGTCRTFDEAAGGTVGADGVGIVVLKRLSDAIADRDHVRAVIRGTATNNDGADRIGFTAPSVEGQAAAVRDAQLVAGVRADEITYVEAHGTATPLGDPIEIAALSRAFRLDTEASGYCGIGSVKTNIGHADAAAGAAGLIKTVLALEHGVLPPSLHFTRPNPRIDFGSSPFRVVTKAETWKPDGMPRRAGVSSFGIGGTNAHVVLEQPPAPRPARLTRPWHLVPMSARTPDALTAQRTRLAEHLVGHPDQQIADVAWTLQVGRTEHPYRGYLVVKDGDDVAAAINEPDGVVLGDNRAGLPRVVFVFPADGTDVRDAARLYRAEPEFRRAADEACDCLDRTVAADIRATLRRAVPRADPATDTVLDFVVGYGLARLWSQWGVRPTAVSGTGVGALAAGTVAGVFTLPAAVGLASALPTSNPADLVRDAGPRQGDVPVIVPNSGQELEVTDTRAWADLLSTSDVATDRIAGAVVRIRPTGPAATLHTLGSLWLAGAQISWEAVHEGQPLERVPLPGYPFQREPFVVAPAAPETPDPAQPPADSPAGLPVEVVARLFAAALELPSVTPEDDFFELGGDSLVAVTMLDELSSMYHADLGIETLLERPTPAGLAEVLPVGESS